MPIPTVAGADDITVDADTDNDGTGDFAIADAIAVTTNNNDLIVTANEVNLNATATINTGTGTATFNDSDGTGVGFGDTAVAGGLNISSGELQRITSAQLELDTAGDMTVDNISALNSNNITTMVLDAGGTITFANNPSIFNAFNVQADDGIIIDQDITTDTGNLLLDGDADNAVDGNDDIQIAAGITLQAQGGITLDATSPAAGNITAAGTLDLICETDITINNSLLAQDVITFDTDLDNNSDGVGDFIVAAGATVGTTADNVDITANDFDLDGNLDVQTADLNIIVSDDADIGLGANPGGLTIDDAELGRDYCRQP